MTSGSLYCEIQAYPSIHSMMFLSFVSFYVQQYTHPKVLKKLAVTLWRKWAEIYVRLLLRAA